MRKQAVSIIANALDNSASILNYSAIDLHPIDKVIKFHEERWLYERMLKEKEGDDGEIGAVMEK